MKNYEEMTERVFERIHEYESRRVRRRKAFRRIMLAASPVCIAFIIGAGFYMNGLTKPPEQISSIQTESSKAEAVPSEHYEAPSRTGLSQVSTSVTEKKNEKTETSASQPQTEEITETRAEVQENAAVCENTEETVQTTIVKQSVKAVTQQSAAAGTTQTAKASTTTAATQSIAEASVTAANKAMDMNDRIYALNIGGIMYLQIGSFNGKADRFTADEMIGHGWDYEGGDYWDNREVYTTKESKYILIVRDESGMEIILKRENDLIANGREYFITMWDANKYEVKESNFIGTVSEYEVIDFPYIQEIRDADSILEPECRLYTADEDNYILIAVHANGNAVILHEKMH